MSTSAVAPAGGAGHAGHADLDRICLEGQGILAVFISWIKGECSQIAPFNRKSVKTRPGDSNQLLDSLARGISIGTLIGYVNGPVVEKPVPTKANPIYITEGGHRFRWLQEIANGTAQIYGHNLLRIQEVNPSLYDRIMNYKIRIDISMHESGVVPESFIREEYKRTNTLGCPLKTGEITRALTNENFKLLEDSLKECFDGRQNKMEASARDKANEILAAFIQIITNAKDVTNDLIPTKENLVALAPLDSSMAEAMECVESMTAIEEKMREEFGSNKKTRKFLHQEPKIELFAPMFYGLATATDKKAAAASIETFMRKSLESPEVWKANSDRVKKLGLAGKEKTNGGNRNCRKRYLEGWNTILSIIGGGMTGGGSAVAVEIEYD
jgi:hypothetical protein